MANPTPTYRVKFDGQYLPGYLQTEGYPLTMRNVMVDIINRDGGVIYSNGAMSRDLSLEFRVLSRLTDQTASGLEELEDCMDQYRDALAVCARAAVGQPLYIGPTDTDKYVLATFKDSDYQLLAPDHDAINYTLNFSTSPYFLGPVVSGSQAVSGDTSIGVVIGDTRKTYPEITIPSGITAITVSHTPSGKSFTFAGSHANPVTVYCDSLIVEDSAGTNYVASITSGPDFGIYHVGSGTMTLNITGVTGSGTVVVRMQPRTER
jgi:hypothetical protein